MKPNTPNKKTEQDEDSPEVGAYRLAKMRHQNKQLAEQGKPQAKLPPGVKRK